MKMAASGQFVPGPPMCWREAICTRTAGATRMRSRTVATARHGDSRAVNRNQSGHRGLVYRAYFKDRETAVKIAKIVLAATAALAINSAALAQQGLTGTITKIDRINSIVEIQQTQSGTTGANSGGTTQEYKTQRGLSLDKLHAGDKVTFSATEIGGVKTITKFQE